MKVRCPGCSNEYAIKEEQLKAHADKKFLTIPCPNCKTAIRIETGTGAAAQQEQGGETAPQAHSSGSRAAEMLKKRIFRSLKDLPPMPQVAHKARQVLDDPNSSFNDLARVIESDQGIVTRVLKMANSPYYGQSGNVSSVQHASAVLGAKTLMEVLTLACSSEILGKTLDGYDLAAGDLWMHSLAVANGSRLIARRVQPSLEQDAFSAGLIHDVGKIILDPYVFERKAEFQAVVSNERESFLSAEKRILGFDHAELAAEVCEQWQMPGDITKPIRYHHDPEPSGDDALSYIVHMADAIAIMSGIGSGIDGMLYSIRKGTMDFLKLREDDLGEIMAEIADYVEKTSREI